MITAAPIAHIRLDQQGVAWIDDTNVKVIEVIADYLAYGHSAEQIQREHPHLTLAQVYATFTYYHDYKAELDAELERRHQEVEALREQSPSFVTRRTLQARLKDSAQ